MTKPKLELVGLRKEYDGGNVIAVDDVDLAVQAGETIALLGSSGCGKSTTLNMVVGLEEPTSGDIQIDGASVVRVPAGKRNVGLVFQDYAVFTSMTVRKNLAFGLEVRGDGKTSIAKAVDEVAELLGMQDKLDARAKDLGGSELQRVAIGRTLVTKPSILLLDEPLSNLETAARLAMRKELRRLQKDIGLTIIYVTHDQVEALSLADRIAVMNMGHVLQVEKTATICANPDHTFVAGFLGSPPMNLVRGTFEQRGERLFFSKDGFTLDLQITGTAPQGFFTLGVRAESLQLVQPGSEHTAQIEGSVSLVEPRGPDSVLTVKSGLQRFKAVVDPTVELHKGQQVGLRLAPDALHFFDGDHNRRVDINFAQGQSS